MTETMKNIEDMTKSLGSAARERLEAAAAHEKLYDALRKAQAEFVAASVPEMMDAQSRLHAVLTAVDPVIDDVTHAAGVVEQLGNVIASGNLMTSNMAAALSATSSDTLEAIEKEFKETIERVKSNLEMLPKNAGGKTMGEASAKLQALGQGKNASSRSARRNSTPPIMAKPFWRKPASSMSGSASACSSSSTASARRPTHPPSRRGRRFRSPPS